MRNKIVFTIALLAIILAFGSCQVHTAQGAPYRVWHITKRTHRHWGAHRFTSNKQRFWGRHRRYGPRSYRSRGHFRQYQNQ